MCAMLIGVPAGKPVRFTANVAVAELTLPEPSVVELSVMVTVPPPADSAPVTAGTSSEGLSVAVKVRVVVPDGVAGELLPHAATVARATVKANTDTYFIVTAPVDRIG